MMGFRLSSIQLPAPQKQCCGIVLMIFILSGLCCFKTSNGECMQPAFPCEGSGNGSTDGEGSGSADGGMMKDDCPLPDCIDVTLIGSDQANVSFSLDCTPTNITSCSYSYSFQYLAPDDGVIFHIPPNQPNNLSSSEVNQGYFILSLSDDDEFVPGSIVRIVVFLSSNISFNGSDNVTIPGSFAPDVINFTVNSGNSTSLVLSWELRYPLVPPDMYYIDYNYTELSGTNPRSGTLSPSIMIDEDDVTKTADYILYTLDDLMPFTRYYVTLFPQYGDEGGEGLVDYGSTEEGMSSAVINTTVDIDRNDMRLNISWDPPSYPAGIILKYEVTLSIGGRICLTINTTELSVTAEFKFNVTYTIRITPFNSFGSGTTREIDMFATPEGAPTPPLNFRLTEQSSSSLEASWEEPSTLNGVLTNYTIYCSLSSSQFYSEQLMLSINEPSTTVDPVSTTANITGLYPFTSYECYATASTGGGKSSRSNNASARTSQEEPAGPPEGFNFTDVTATSVSLEWRRPSVPNGVILDYILQYSTSTVTIPVTFNSDSDEYNVTSYTVESLNEYTNYTFNISAVTSGGTGPLAITSTRTSEAVPGIVSDFSATEINTTAISVGWSGPAEPNGIITRYELMYSKDGEAFVAMNYTDIIDSYSIVLNNLDPFSTYVIQVRAYTSVGAGPFTSGSVRTDPAPSTPPTNINATAITQTSLVLNWSPPDYPNGIIEGYYIRYNATPPNNIIVSNLSTGEQVLNVSADDTSISFIDLTPYTLYTFSIAAYSFHHADDNNEFLIVIGMFSQDETFRTLEAAPTPPLNFRLTEQSSTSLEASWEEPSTLNGVLTNYTVYCSLSSSQFYSEQLMLSINVPSTTVDPVSTTANITGLYPFTSYECYATASTGGGKSSRSNNASARTSEEEPAGPPEGFNFTDVTATSVSLEWRRPSVPNGVILHYILQYSTGTVTIPVTFNSDSDEYNVTSYTVESLNEYTNYTFNISAVTSGGTGPLATTSTRTSEAAPSSPPQNLDGFNTSSMSLRITWTEPLKDDQNGFIIGYNISYFSLSAGGQPTNEFTSNTSLNISGLDVYTDYNISVAAYTSAGTGPFDSIMRRTDSSVPTSPLSVSYINISSTSIEVSWSPPTDFNGPNEGYAITYIRLENNTKSSTNRLTNTSFVIEDLEKYEQYNVTVVAFTDKGPGTPSDVLSVLTDEDLPGIVSGFSATEINTTAISVEWSGPTEPNGIITRFELIYSKDGDELEPVNFTDIIDSYSIVLNNLDPFSTYVIQVRAYTSVGAGPFTSGSVRTDPAPSTPPTNINATAITQTTLVLNWSPPDYPNGIIEGFYIRYNATPPNNIIVSNLSTGEQVLNVSADDTSISFIGLTPYTLYTFSIAAYSFHHADDNNEFLIVIGMFSQNETFRTLEAAPTPPLNFTLTEQSSTSLEASWEEPSTLNGVLTNYTVYCSLSSSQFYSEQLMLSKNVPSTTVDPVSTTANITGLYPFTSYECYATASTGGGKSSRSNNASARTSEEEPAGPPEGFIVTDVTATSVSLEWRRPSVPNGVILDYILQYSTSTVTIPVAFNSDSDEYNVTSYTVESLNEYTVYTFNISAVTSGGTGPLATTSTRTGEAAPSSPPQNLDGFNTSSMSLRITWTEPLEDDQNGVIIGYNISYFSLSAGGQPTNEFTSNTSLNISGLDVYTDYNISVAAYTSAGTGPFDSIMRRTDSSVPTSPLSVSYMNVSSTSIEVSWSPPTDFNGPNEGYAITYIRLENNTKSSTNRLTNTSFVIENLEKYEQYNVTVVAFTDKGPGTPSDVLFVLTDEDLPGIVSDFSATEINTTAISVGWSEPAEPNGIITRYELMYSKDGEALEAMTYTDIIDSYSIVLNNLDPFSTYVIQVRAYTSVGAGPFTSGSVRTDPAPSSPPTNINATAITQTSLVLNWSPPDYPNGIIEGYYIRYNATPPNNIIVSNLSTGEQVLNVSADDTSISFVDLTPYTLYTFSIAAYSFDSNQFLIVMGMFSQDETFRTLEAAPTPPLNFRLTEQSSTSLEASWEEPSTLNGVLTNYTVYCSLSSSQFYSKQLMLSNNVPSTTVDPVSTTANITGLYPFTSYECYATASTGGGKSSRSNNASAITSEEEPAGPPEGFNVSDVTATSVSLEWRRPSVPNGVILDYILQYSTSTVTIPVTFNSDSDEYNVTSYTVESLNEYTVYTFNISAVTGGGTGPLATTSTRTSEAAPSSPPQNLDGFSTSSMSLRITWTEPLEDDQNGVIIGYNISYFSLSAGGQPTNDFTSNTSLNISGLDVYTDYNVSVAAYTSAGTGPFDSIIRRTDSTVPTSPLSVSYMNISSTSIEVSWSPPTDFNGPNEGYAITYIRLENNTESSTNRLTNTSFVIEDLEIYEQYNVTVVAFTDKGPGTPSDVLSVLTDEDLPGPPSNVATTSTDTSINITWSPPLDPNGLLLSYSINLTLNSTYAQYLSSYVSTISVVPQDTLSSTLSGLLPFAGYDISLQASTSVGLGTPAIETETTLEAAPAAPVTNLTAIPDNATAVTVSWLPPNLSDWNGLITNYTIQYSTDDDNIRPSEEGTATLSSFVNPNDPRAITTQLQLESIIIPSLHEFVNYSFVITLSNSIGQISSLPVYAVTLESAPSGAPLDVSVIVNSSSTARISWSPPTYIDRNGIIVNYTVRIITTDTDRGTIREANVADNYYDASELPQFASFNVTVAAATSVGLGPYSPSVSNMTFEGVPSAPDSIVVERRNDTAIQVTWARPVEPNGIILGYLIHYIGTKNNTVIDYPDINVLFTINVTDPNILSYLITNLLADTQYSINVTAYTSAGVGAVGDGGSILLPAGRPPTIPPNVTIGTPPTDDTTDTTTATTIAIEFTIPEELNANGPLMRARVLIRIFTSGNNSVDTWYASQNFPSAVAPAWQAVQVPLNEGNRRKRQAGGETVAETIGTDGSCGPNDIVCNGPLKPGTQYQFKYRVYNSDDDDSYVESQYSGPISTDQVVEEDNTATATIVIAVVVVLLVIILLIAILVIVVVIVLKRRKRKAYSFAASFNGKEELITAGEGKGATLSKAIQLTPTDPTIVPLTENTIVNPTAVRTASVKATPNSRKVYLRDFPSYVEDMLNDAGYKFSEEYEKVSAVGLDHSKDASLLPENRAKNRYTNILAYDHSRVKLESIDDEPGSDYINANYIPGYRMRRAYIATQGPLPSTFDDFWRMTWEQNSHVIVMLTQLVERGRTKCHRYWPGAQPEVYGEINVDMLSETEKSDWIVRKFKITKEKRSRTITHYQFVSWPDHGVPDEAGPALDFVREVHEVASSAFGPVIVHCSAGVGRTGTFIALGTLMQHIKDHDWVDLFGLASEMRQHRNHMIQTEPQYVFIHKSMVEACKSSMSKFGGGVKVLPSFPIYSNIGTASQQSDFYGDMLSEEASYQYQKTSGNGKTYDESTF